MMQHMNNKMNVCASAASSQAAGRSVRADFTFFADVTAVASFFIALLGLALLLGLISLLISLLALLLLCQVYRPKDAFCRYPA